MSVLVVTSGFPDGPDSYRGVFIRELVRRMADRGWRQTVVTPRVKPGSPTLVQDGTVRVVRWEYGSRGKLLVEYARTPYVVMLRYIAMGMIAAIREGRRMRAKLVHAHWVLPTGLIGAVAALYLRVPFVATAHGTDLHDLPRRGLLMRRFARFVLSRADATICVSVWLTERAVELGAEPERTIAFGLVQCADERFTRAAKIDGRDAECDVVSTRSLESVYDVETLVKATADLRDRMKTTRVFVAGDGTRRPIIERLIQELGLTDRVRLLGRVNHVDLPRLLNGARVYVSTSFADGAASVSLIEALACGCFPVVSDIPPNREWIVSGENGLLFPCGDHVALAGAIARALDDPELRRRAAERNMRVVRERARWEPNLDRLEAIYKKLLSS